MMKVFRGTAPWIADASDSHRVRRRHVEAGFTLVEIALVLFVIGLVAAAMLGPLEVQLEARDRRRTQAAMAHIVESLYGYAITFGRLPCPDVTGDGLPDPAFDSADPLSAVCADAGRTGFLPWRELNVAPGDAWGNRIRYRVRAPQFTRPEADDVCDGDDYDPGEPTYPEFDLCATGDITVYARGDDPATGERVEGKAPHVIAAALPAVILSTGRNAHGAVALDGAPRAAVRAASDEAENVDNDTLFFSRTYSAARADCADDSAEGQALCGFDDIVQWLSPAVLNHRLVQAGRLP